MLSEKAQLINLEEMNSHMNLVLSTDPSSFKNPWDFRKYYPEPVVTKMILNIMKIKDKPTAKFFLVLLHRMMLFATDATTAQLAYIANVMWSFVLLI